MGTRSVAALALAPLLLLACTDARCQDEEPVRDLGIVERAERRLVQIDVTVLGPAERVAALTADDFRVTIGGREIDSILVDRLCGDEETASGSIAAGSLQGAGAARPVSPRGTSYLFYFDQHHLTMAGRERSIELARELVERLIGGADRAMIVSAGLEVRTFVGFTSDREELYAALERLREDARQWDPYASQEDARVAEVHGDLGVGLDAGAAQARGMRGDDLSDATRDALGGRLDGRQIRVLQNEKEKNLADQQRWKGLGITHAMLTARRYQREEKWHTERALSRFAMVVGRLEDVDPPKAVIYFADRMRSNAGDHYIELFSDASEGGRPAIRGVGGENLPDVSDPTSQVLAGANLPVYDQVIDEAAAHGARLYTVQAEGLISGVSGARGSSTSIAYQSLGSAAATKRFTDAKNGLAGLAMETGGQAFLNGVGPAKIARKIEADLGCVYLISFDAAGLPEDNRLPLNVLVDDSRLEVRARTRLVVPSESALLVTRLTNAFGGGGQGLVERLRTVVIPTGFGEGRYSALVQVRVPGAAESGTTWDVGLSALSRGRPGLQASARVSVPDPGVPVVFEAEMEFAPGPYEVTAVAHDLLGDLAVSGRVEGEWPDPDDDAATVGPIAVVQPAEAVFVRGGEHRASGPLARTEDEFVLPDRPTALVAIVCRDRPRKLALDVERRLTGQTAVGFPPLAVEAGEDRCILLGDLVPAGVMTEGAFVYSVRVLGEEGELAGAAREFAAIRPADEPPPAGTPLPR